MLTLDGTLYPAGRSKGSPARLRYDGGKLTLEHDEAAPDSIPLAGIKADAAVHGVPRRLTLPDGSCFITTDHAAAARLLGGHPDRKQRGRLALLEGANKGLLAFLAVALVGLLVLFRWGLPLVADGVTAVIPAGVEQAIGESAFKQMDGTLFSASALPQPRRMAIQDTFDRLRRIAGLPDTVRLEFRKSRRIGPNAIAFPGGPVVLLDSLVDLAPNATALAGVLAHELGHVTERHGLRRIVRTSLLAIAITVTLQDMGSVVDEMAGVGVVLAAQANSRDFERDADDHGVALLEKAGLDPRAYADMLRALYNSCRTCGEGSLSWLSSHPAPEERLKRLPGAAEPAPTQPR